MEYKDLVDNYTPEMELIDALDYLRDQPWPRFGDPRPLGFSFQ